MAASSKTGVFSPVTLAGHTLRNRICLTATLTNYGTGSRVTDAWKNFLIERARGGAGMLVTEGIAVDPNAIAHPAVVAGFDPENHRGFSETASACHDAGAVIVAQLWHAGRQQLWHPTRSPQGVSDQPDAYSWSVPHVMTDAEIKRVIAGFVDVAKRFANAGFNGVELHGAHGYLITQFLSPWSNTRTDAWGGSLEKRARFCLEIGQQIRKACGSEFIIGIKLPADEGVEGGIGLETAEAITRHLDAEMDFDYFAYSQGNFSRSLENHVPDMHFEPGHYIKMHKHLRTAANGTPVMALGRIGTGTLAERVVSEGYGDLVGMSRALIADADLPNKLKNRQEKTVRPCLYDNYSWGVIHMGKPLHEAQNPLVGVAGESSWRPAPATEPKRVTVVGAGPSGLECAWVAAARGHKVTLISGSKKAGGALALEAALPGHAGVADLITWQERNCAENKVVVISGTKATAKSIQQTTPDVVILATGASLRTPTSLESGVDRCLSVREFARRESIGQNIPQGRTAVLYDHDQNAAVYAAAIALKKTHDRVIISTPRTEIAQPVNHCSKLGINRRLYGEGIDIRIATEPVSWDEDVLRLRNVFGDQVELFQGVDTVVYATPRLADDSLAHELEGELPVHLIGDSASPRNLMIAIHEAHAVANAL